ncbi:MAG: HNH endonuclease signature motif containing protein [Nostocales cyanobacterium 94392]|nr:HNH endonuclease signature motif containing protein [Nostocales cyanobacterium 94392]
MERNSLGQFVKGMVTWNKKEPIIKNCEYCQREFSVKPSLDRVRYCSRSCIRKGKPSPMKGKKVTPETRLKQRLAKLGIRGEKHWNWRGGNGKTERKIEMARDEYKQWRKAVFERDNYRCLDCGERGGFLNADHIYPWALYPRLRYKIENGRTLCRSCHEKTNTWGARVRKIAPDLRITERN